MSSGFVGRSKFVFVVLALIFMLLMSSCYLNRDVAPSEVGIQLYRNAIIGVVGPGVYSDFWRFFADFETVDVGAMTFSVEDPEVLTKDNQAVGVRITIQARRESGTDAVKNLLTNWPALIDNQVFIDTISATAREGIKNGVRGFSLAQLLDDRNGLADAVRSQLQSDADKYSGLIINVTVENIEPSKEFMSVLNEKALLKVETEKETERGALIEQKAKNDVLQAQKDVSVLDEQLKKQEAQTRVDVEIASREGKKTAAQYEVYKTNQQAYEIRRMEILRDTLNDKTVLMFIPQGTDLNMILSQTSTGNIIPVPVPGGGQP